MSAMKKTTFFIIVITIVTMMTSLTDARTVASMEGVSPELRKSVEVVVIVDRPAYIQWSQHVDNEDDDDDDDDDDDEEREERIHNAITQFVHATFRSANLITKGLEEYGVFLDLRIDRLRVVTDDDIVTSHANGRSVDNEVAFWDFQRWLMRNGYEFDHALLLTGYDLTGEEGESGHEGYAYMDTMCGIESVSVVENIMNGIPAVVVAHEVGHSLSARHDGNRNRCHSQSGFIMNNDDIGTSTNHWRWSNCSGWAVRSKLLQLQESFDCLNQDGGTWSPPVDSPLLGQLYSGDELCRMAQGQHSYVCRHLYNRPHSRSICHTLWCLVNASYCAGLAPVDGLPCGSGRRCLAGNCQPFDDVPGGVTDQCYTGDRPGPAWRGQTCGQVVGGYTHMCHDQWYQDFCCQTCLSFRRPGNDACPYGDAHARCNRWYCNTRWEDECCETCAR